MKSVRCGDSLNMIFFCYFHKGSSTIKNSPIVNFSLLYHCEELTNTGRRGLNVTHSIKQQKNSELSSQKLKRSSEKFSMPDLMFDLFTAVQRAYLHYCCGCCSKLQIKNIMNKYRKKRNFNAGINIFYY